MAEMEKTNLETEELDAVSGGCKPAVVEDTQQEYRDFLLKKEQSEQEYKLKDKELGIEKYKAVTERKKAIFDSGMSVFKIVGDIASAGTK